MKKPILFLLIALFFTLPTHAEDWSLDDPTLGWNTRELIALYFHHSELQTQWAFEALSNYRVKGDEKVLDFGSGDGKISALLSYMVPDGSVTGVDLSKQMVFYATKMFPYSNLTFQVSPDVDFSETEFAEKFDLVTSFCVFHLVPNPLAVFQGIRKCMAPDGHLVMTLPIGGNYPFFLAVSEEMEKRGLDFPSPTKMSKLMRNPNKIQELVSSAGFDVTHFKVIDVRFPFSSKEEMVDWFEGTLTANWNIPKEIRREFFVAVADRYLQYRPDDADEDGFVYFSLQKVDLVATPS